MAARFRWVCVGLLCLALSTHAAAYPPPQGPPAPPLPTRQRADAAFAAKKYEHALHLYLQLYLEDRLAHAELRNNIKECLRLSAQVRRQRDPAFQQYVLNLPMASALSLYAETIQNLATNYAERERATPNKLFALGLLELERAFADATFRQTHLGKIAEAKLTKFQADVLEFAKGTTPDTPLACRHAVREIVALAQSQLGIKNGSALVLEFLCGACTGLDEFTLYVQPSRQDSDLAGPVAELANYGILYEIKAGQILIDAIIPQSFAALHTPFRKGDRVIRVNGKDLSQATPSLLAEALRNPTTVGHQLEVVMPVPDMGGSIRLPTPAPTVFGETMLKEGVGYIRIASFKDGTARELEAKLQILQSRGMQAMVLDLRGNTGGVFTEAIQVAQRFLPAGIIVTTRGQSPEVDNRVFSSDSGMSALDLPLVVLVDTRTMSSAEILAGALRDQNRATVVGMPTFGKGGLQGKIKLLSPDANAMPTPAGTIVFTMGKTFGPNGRAIEGEGIMPHVLEPDGNKQLETALARAVDLAGPIMMMPMKMNPEKP